MATLGVQAGAENEVSEGRRFRQRLTEGAHGPLNLRKSEAGELRDEISKRRGQAREKGHRLY
jgi:hypothetical protein